MFPVADQVPVSGSYNSAEVSFSSSEPPATSTRPSRSRTACVAIARRAHRPGGDPDACRTRDGGRGRLVPVRLAGRRAWSHDARKAGAGICARRRARTPGHHEQRATECEHGHDCRRGERGSGHGPLTVDGSRPGAGAEPAGWRRSWDGRPPRCGPPPPSPPTARRSSRKHGGAPRTGPRTVSCHPSPSSDRRWPSSRASRARVPEGLMCSARASSVESNPAT